MRNKLFSLLLVFLISGCFAFSAYADEATTSAVLEPTAATQSEVIQTVTSSEDSSLIDELKHIDKHLDFFTTFIALMVVVIVIVALWLLFGRWFFRY